MWIHSTLGFFSLTNAPFYPGFLQLRARDPSDLKGFLSACEGIIGPSTMAGMKKIIETEDSDYRWRILFPEHVDTMVMNIFLKTITYDNFKSEIARTPGQKYKLHDLHEIWAITCRWQDRAIACMRPRRKLPQGYAQQMLGEAPKQHEAVQAAKGGQHTNSSPMQGGGNVKRQRQPKRRPKLGLHFDLHRAPGFGKTQE
jgi:hypothetical protein